MLRISFSSSLAGILSLQIISTNPRHCGMDLLKTSRVLPVRRKTQCHGSWRLIDVGLTNGVQIHPATSAAFLRSITWALEAAIVLIWCHHTSVVDEVITEALCAIFNSSNGVSCIRASSDTGFGSICVAIWHLVVQNTPICTINPAALRREARRKSRLCRRGSA